MFECIIYPKYKFLILKRDVGFWPAGDNISTMFLERIVKYSSEFIAKGTMCQILGEAYETKWDARYRTINIIDLKNLTKNNLILSLKASVEQLQKSHIQLIEK